MSQRPQAQPQRHHHLSTTPADSFPCLRPAAYTFSQHRSCLIHTQYQQQEYLRPSKDNIPRHQRRPLTQKRNSLLHAENHISCIALLPRNPIHSSLNGQLLWVRNQLRGNNPWPQRRPPVESLAH